MFAELAKGYPLPRTSNNATAAIDILKAFALNTLCGGKRFAHCRRLQDDSAVAKITGMHKGRLCGEDAFRRLCEKPTQAHRQRQKGHRRPPPGRLAGQTQRRARAAHTEAIKEAIKSRYELLLIPAKLVLSGRRKIIKLAVGGKFASFLKQAYQRLEEWLARTAPQLSLSMGKPPPWLLFAPCQTQPSAHA